MLRRLLLPLLLVGFMGWYANPASATQPGLRQHVTGTLLNGQGSFVGTMVIQKLTFANDQNMLTVVGILNGVATLPDGTTQRLEHVPFAEEATLTRSSGSTDADSGGSCQILTLVTGAIHLNLLGLVVNIAPLDIHVIALPDGGLLGSLLCAIAHLLGPGPFGPLLKDLTQVNQLLSSL